MAELRGMSKPMTTKEKRKALLRRLDQLELQRCDTCKGSATDSRGLNCQCAPAVEIRRLGDELLTLNNKRKPFIADERRTYDPAMVELASQNGIAYDWFWQRVNRYGWTELRAATEPVKSKKKKGEA